MEIISHLQSVQSFSRVRLFVTPWTAALQASLSITNSRNLLKLMSIESVMLSNHLILCCPLLLPSVFPSIRVFSNESVHSGMQIASPKSQLFASGGQSNGISASVSVLPMNGLTSTQQRKAKQTENQQLFLDPSEN